MYCVSNEEIESGKGKDWGPKAEKNNVAGQKAWGSGSRSECYEDVRDSNRVVWKVRMQGEEKNGPFVGPKGIGWHWYREAVRGKTELVTYWQKK